MKRLSVVTIAVSFVVLVVVPGISRAQGMIDLNTANSAELERLPGVGPEMAAKIVAERDANGPYYSLDDLDRRVNVGPGSLAKWQGMVMQGSGKNVISMGTVGTDRITLKSGDVINGDIATVYYEVNTGYASVTLDKEQIWSISLEGGGQNIDTILLRSGNQYSGAIKPVVLHVILSGGQEIDIPKERIRSIQFKN
jgi:hypothetical protein